MTFSLSHDGITYHVRTRTCANARTRFLWVPVASGRVICLGYTPEIDARAVWPFYRGAP